MYSGLKDMRPMNDKELYSELGNLTKRKEDWKDNISFVGTLLENQLSKITAKTLWLLGEMGLQYPHQIEPNSSIQSKLEA